MHIRPMGISWEILASNSLLWLLKTPPGEIAFTLTFEEAQYVARYLVSPITPVLIIEYETGLTFDF